MIGSKGGLNIKDYPFAFSLAALIFPSLLTGLIVDTGVDDEAERQLRTLGMLFGITIFGGMVGSFLTITDPFGLIIRWIYRRTPKKWILENLRRNNFIIGIINKNYDAALKSPSITYETDKIVGIFYFIVILGLTSFRLIFDINFRAILPLGETELSIALYFTLIILIGVILAIILNVKGIRKSVSHLRRIETVTILFTTNDLTNISIEGSRVVKSTFVNMNPQLIKIVHDTLRRIENKNISLEDFLKKFHQGEIRDFYLNKLTYHKYDDKQMKVYWWNYFIIVRDLAERYDLSIDDTLVWHNNNNFLQPGNLDAPLSNLQSSVDTRDWQNAVLKTTRITDHLNQFFTQKRFI